MIKTIFMVIGIISSCYLLAGLIIDITSFDQTKGGYEPPYEGWTGTPVQWDSLDKTQTGLVKRGYVMDVHIHGTTGMISFELFGKKIDWRAPSDRALKVHKPREALRRRGFTPKF